MIFNTLLCNVSRYDLFLETFSLTQMCVLHGMCIKVVLGDLALGQAQILQH